MSAAQVTEAHRELARRIMLEFTQAGTATASDVRMAAQLIADSEAKACAELRGALALGQQNCDDVFEDLRNERDQLRAERNNLRADLDAIKAIRDEETARAEYVEAELAAEREKVRVLRDACESICEEWGRNHDANPIGAGQRMETMASKALEDVEEAE